MEIQQKNFSKEISWLIGLWTGDNFSSRTGTVTRNGRATSGRFGINCNDTELVQRAVKILKGMESGEVRIDVQLPRNQKFAKSEMILHANKIFGINKVLVYKGSEWRRHLGYAAYINSTALLRNFHEVYKSLPDLISGEKLDIGAFLQGLADAEADVNKVSKLVTLHTKEAYVLSLMEGALKKLKIEYSVVKDKKDRYRVYVKDLENFSRKVGFFCERKDNAVSEILSGNFMRAKDLEYLNIFTPHLKGGATVREVQRKTELPYSTVGIVLRNLHSGNLLKREMIGRKNRGFNYVYYLT